MHHDRAAFTRGSLKMMQMTMLRVPPLLLFLTLLLFLEGGVCYNAPNKRTVHILMVLEINICAA